MLVTYRGIFTGFIFNFSFIFKGYFRNIVKYKIENERMNSNSSDDFFFETQTKNVKNTKSFRNKRELDSSFDNFSIPTQLKDEINSSLILENSTILTKSGEQIFTA